MEGNVALQEMQQVLLTPLNFYFHARKPPRSTELWLSLFKDLLYFVKLISADSYEQLLLDRIRQKRQSIFSFTSTQVWFESLMFLHFSQVLWSPTKGRTEKVEQWYTAGSLIQLCLQLLAKAWRQLLEEHCAKGFVRRWAQYKWPYQQKLWFLLLSK